MRTMYDSTNPAAIPTTAELVGGYTDGIYGPNFKAIGASATGWDAAAWARFPNSVHVLISAIGTNSGTVGDVEPGCIWPVSLGVSWVQMRRRAGVDPSIYCNETYHLPLVRAAFRDAGVPEPHYWCSNYDGVAVLRPGEVARQIANPTLTKHHYDLSVVADFWPGVDGLQSGGSGSLEADMTSREHELLVALVSQFVDIAETTGPPPTKTELNAILKAVTDGNAAIVAAIKAIPLPAAPVIDTAAIAAAVVAQMPRPIAPPVPTQAVKDWWAQLTHWLGLS